MPNLRVLCVRDSRGSRVSSERRQTARKSIPRHFASPQPVVPNAVRDAVRDVHSCPMLRPLRPRRLVLLHWYRTERAFRFAARFDRRAQHCLQSVTMIHRSKDTLPAALPEQIKIRDLTIVFDPKPSRLWPPPRPKAAYTHCATICIRSIGQVRFTNTESLEPEQLGEGAPKVSQQHHFGSSLRSMIDQLTESETDRHLEAIHEKVHVVGIEDYLASHDWEGEFEPEEVRRWLD